MRSGLTFPFDINELTQEFINRYFEAKDQAERDKITLDCLLHLLEADQLSNPQKFLAWQKPLLTTILNLSADKRLAALQKVLTPSTGLGKFFSIDSNGKPISLKREDSCLFEALNAYSMIRAETEPDFNFQLANKLNQLLKYRSSKVLDKFKRSEKVIKTLLNLLQKSFSKKNLNQHRFNDIYNLLMPKDKSEVALPGLIGYANTRDLLMQYADFLGELLESGMESDKVLSLLEEKMYALYKNNPTLCDLAFNLKPEERQAGVFMPIAKLIVHCLQKNPQEKKRLIKIASQSLLNIGSVYSSYTSKTVIDKLYESINQTVSDKIFYSLWVNNFFDQLGKDKKPLQVDFQLMIIAQFEHLPIDEKNVALTLAKTSDLFSPSAPQIQAALSNLAKPRDAEVKISPPKTTAGDDFLPLSPATQPLSLPLPVQLFSSPSLPPYATAMNNPFIPPEVPPGLVLLTREHVAALQNTAGVQTMPGGGLLIPASDTSTTSWLMSMLPSPPGIEAQAIPSAPYQTIAPTHPAYFDQRVAYSHPAGQDEKDPRDGIRFNPFI